VYKLVRSEMKKHKEWSIDSAAIGVAWLDDQVQILKKSMYVVLSIFTSVHFFSAIIYNDMSTCSFP
jgi:hypothetical protein